MSDAMLAATSSILTPIYLTKIVIDAKNLLNFKKIILFSVLFN